MTERKIGEKIKVIDGRLTSLAGAAFKKYGVTLSQTRVLKYINDSGGEAFQTDVERYIGSSHPTIVGILSRLERDGFLESRYEKDDKLRRKVVMTKKARDIGEGIFADVEKIESAMTAGFSVDEIDELKRLLDKIIDNI
mgnify:CR=1 FL=1